MTTLRIIFYTIQYFGIALAFLIILCFRYHKNHPDATWESFTTPPDYDMGSALSEVCVMSLFWPFTLVTGAVYYIVKFVNLIAKNAFESISYTETTDDTNTPDTCSLSSYQNIDDVLTTIKKYKSVFSESRYHLGLLTCNSFTCIAIVPLLQLYDDTVTVISYKDGSEIHFVLNSKSDHKLTLLTYDIDYKYADSKVGKCRYIELTTRCYQYSFFPKITFDYTFLITDIRRSKNKIIVANATADAHESSRIFFKLICAEFIK